MSCIIFLILHCNSCTLNGTHFLKCTLSSISHIHWRNVFMMIYWPVQIQCIILILLTNLRITHIFKCIILFLLFLNLFLNWIGIYDVSTSADSYHAFIIIIKPGNMLIMWVISSLNAINSILNHRRIINDITTNDTNVLLRCWTVLSIYINQWLLWISLQIAFWLHVNFCIVVWRRFIHL